MAADLSGGNNAITDNSGYSQDVVTPAQRGRQIIGGRDGNAFDAWETVEQVQNAHDQQAAPTHVYDAPLVDNATHLTPAPVSDHDGDSGVERIEDLTDAVIYPPMGPIVHGR